jgi:hypothetical protein
MALINTPQFFEPLLPYDPNAVRSDSLAIWLPSLAGAPTLSWTPGGGGLSYDSTNVVTAVHQLKTGEDNSLRYDFVPDQYIGVMTSPSIYAPYALCCWVKPYTLQDNYTAGQIVPLFYFYIYNYSYTSLFGYLPATSSLPGRLAFTLLTQYYGPTVSSVLLPLDQWTHVGLSVLRGEDAIKYYINGELVDYLGVNLRSDLYHNIGQYYFGAINAMGNSPSPDYAVKDIRVYHNMNYIKMSDAEMRQVYLESLDFHLYTSDLIPSKIRPIQAEVVVVPPTVVMHQQHHILGAV